MLLLPSSYSIATVRIRSTTLGSSSWILLRLLHGLVLLPCRISGKMTVSLDTFTIIAMLVVSMLSLYVALPIFCCQSLLVAMKPLIFDTIPANCCLAMLPARSAPLIALLVAGEDEDCSMLELVV